MGEQEVNEITQTSEDQWIPHNAGEDLPTEFFGAVEKDKEFRGGETAHARDCTTEGLSEVPVESPQHPPNITVLFARPASLLDDLTSGFSFSKPTSIQTPSFGIKSKQTTLPAFITKDSRNAPLHRQTQRAPPAAPSNDVLNGTLGDEAHTNRETQRNIASKSSTVPFPLPLTSASEESTSIKVQTTPSMPCQTSTASKDQVSPQFCKDPCLESNETTLVDASSTANQAQGSTTQNSGSIQDGDPASPPIDPHNQAPQSNQRKPVARSSRSDTRIPSWLRSQDDVIHMLMFNRQKHSQEFQRLIAAQEAQKEQIAQLRVAKENLNSELQQLYKRLEEKELESEEAAALKTKVQARLKRLTDFLNNLSQNHSQLRDAGYKLSDDMEGLRTEYKQSQIGLQATKEALCTTQETITRERRLWIKQLFQSENQEKLLAQQVEDLRDKLQRAQVITSSDEGARSQRFEEMLNQVLIGREQLLTSFKGHHDELSKHMAQLLDSSAHLSNIDPTPMLGNCVQLLEFLRDRETLQPADLRCFETLVKEDTKAILGSIQSCESSLLEQTNVSQGMVRMMDDSLKKELSDLNKVVAAEQPRHDQLIEIRETKATLQERLQATETALQDARMESAILKTREEGTFHRIASLGDQILQMKAQPATTAVPPHICLRLHDLETRNRDLTQQSNTLRTEFATLSDQLGEKDQDVTTAKGQIASLELQLEESQAKCVATQEQLSTLQDETAVQHQQAAKQLAEAASHDRASLTKELAETQRQLEQAQSNAKALSLQSSEEVNVQSAKYAKLEQLSNEKTGHLRAADAELNRQRKENSLLHEKVISLDQDIRSGLTKQNEKDKEIANLKAMFNQTRALPQPIIKDYSRRPAVVEDSQIEEIPRDEDDFAKYHDDMVHRLMAPQTPKAGPKPVTEAAVIKRLALTPEDRGSMRTSLEGSPSDQQLATYQRPTIVVEMSQVEDSQPDKRNDPAMVGHSLDHQTLSTVASYDSLKATALYDEHVEIALDDVTARNTATNAQGTRPNTKVARKRSITTADLGEPDEPLGLRKVTRSSSRTSGTIVFPDSQSPGHVTAQTSRPAKLSTAQKKGSRRAGLYQKEFNKHLQPREVSEHR